MTAEEYGKYLLPRGIDWYKEFDEMMIGFAKYHVQKALEKAANSDIIIKNRYIHRTKEDKESILNAYPIENIK